MSNWFRKVTADIGHLPGAIDWFEAQLREAKAEISLRGNVEKNARDLPGIIEHRFNQLQEIEAILEHLNIELRRLRSNHFKRYLEHYNRAMSSRDAEKYSDGEPEVLEMQKLINEFALVRNTFQGLIKAIDTKNFMISNITRLRVAGMEDASV
jgi:hypothetical protein